MLDHPLRQSLPIHQHDPLHGGSKLCGLRREGRRRDEDALVGTLTCQGPVKPLHVGTTDGALPAFGLYVHFFETQAIERYRAVDAAVSATTDTLQMVAARAKADCLWAAAAGRARGAPRWGSVSIAEMDSWVVRLVPEVAGKAAPDEPAIETSSANQPPASVRPTAAPRAVVLV